MLPDPDDYKDGEVIEITWNEGHWADDWSDYRLVIKTEHYIKRNGFWVKLA